MRHLCPLALLCLTLVLARTGYCEFRDVSKEWGFSTDGKAAFADFNGDGWVDLYAGGKLYRNDKGERFTEVKDSGIGSGPGIWGDYDNDGLVDLFIYAGDGALYRNLGKGKFQAVPFPKLPTIASQGAIWIDVNNDGMLDLYVGGYEAWQQAVYPDALYINQGNGKFLEKWQSPKNACYSSRGVTAADIDEDGNTDIYVSHYRLQPNILWKNNGKGELKDIAKEFNAAGTPEGKIRYTGGIEYGICGHTIGSAFGDLDNDGHIDLFVGNFSHPSAIQDRPQFLRNRGPKGLFHFEDRSAHAGLAWQESFASPALGDFDNDGLLDLYFTTVYAVGSGNIRNHPVLYRNTGDWKFANVTEPEKVGDLGPTYQAAWADIDNDGDLDLCTNGKIFRNDAKQNHWLILDLRGDGKTVNRSAIGATVRIRLGDRILTRQVEGGTGEGNQNDLRLHFGLGDLVKENQRLNIEITWPGNVRQQVQALAINQIHRVEFEGK